MDLKSTYDRIAEDWNEDHKNDTWWIAGTDKFSSFLKTGDSVLDVGCAGGIKSEYLTKKGFVVTGVDISDTMIEIAQKRLPYRFFFVRDINEPLGLKQEFDGIFAQAVLLHIPKKQAKNTINNLVDLMKPGAYLYIAVKKLGDSEAEEWIIKEKDYGYEYERFFSFFALEELEAYLKDLNVQTIWSNTSAIGHTDWVEIIGQKPTLLT